MKIHIAHNHKLWGGILVAIILVCALANILVYSVFIKDFGMYAMTEEADKYEIRSRLLMDAFDEVGVCSPEQAAQVWASGLQKRSAALQYSVMTSALKADYAKQLEKAFPNWVTGVSSPWVDSFTIKRSDRLQGNRYAFTLLFSTATSTGPAGDYTATVTVEPHKDFWRIAKIAADRQLFPYTGYKAK